MTEQAQAQAPTPVLPDGLVPMDEAVQSMFDNYDDLLDTPVVIVRPDSTMREYWQIHDIVKHKGHDADGNPVDTPMAVLKQPDDSRIQITVPELITWQYNAQELAKKMGSTMGGEIAPANRLTGTLIGNTALSGTNEDDIHMADTIPREKLQGMLGKQPEQAEQIKSVDIHQGLEKDQAFVDLCRPFNEKINAVYVAQKAAFDALERRDPNTDPLYWSDYRHIQEDYAKEAQVYRDELESAVKPMIAERLELLKGDTGPAYMQPGEAIVERHKVESKRGATIVIRSSSGFHSTMGAPRMGQVLTPGRLGDWSGKAGTTTKKNEKTGQKTTSREHIINLAAAMVAGNFGEETHPIRYTRDENAEYDLPNSLRDKIRLYKVITGMHRVAAIRLLEGADALMPGQEQH